jgi:hypothetical protein
MFAFVNKYLNISAGFERIFLFLCGFFLVCHVVGCIWVLLAKLEDDENKSDSWLTPFED